MKKSIFLKTISVLLVFIMLFSTVTVAFASTAAVTTLSDETATAVVKVGDELEDGIVVDATADFCKCCHSHNHESSFIGKLSCLICRVITLIKKIFGKNEENVYHRYTITETGDFSVILSCVVCGKRIYVEDSFEGFTITVIDEKETIEQLEKQNEESKYINVYLAVDCFILGNDINDFIVDPVKLRVPKNSTAAATLKTILRSKGIGMTSSGSGHSFYLNAIEYPAPEEIEFDLLPECLKNVVDESTVSFNKREGKTLGECDYTVTSGWMYSVDGVYPNVGMGGYTLSEGDVIRVSYTLFGYGADIGGYFGSENEKYYDYNFLTDEIRSCAEGTGSRSALISKAKQISVQEQDNTEIQINEIRKQNRNAVAVTENENAVEAPLTIPSALSWSVEYVNLEESGDIEKLNGVDWSFFWWDEYPENFNSYPVYTVNIPEGTDSIQVMEAVECPCFYWEIEGGCLGSFNSSFEGEIEYLADGFVMQPGDVYIVFYNYASVHTHTMKALAEKKNSCTESGNIECFFCTGCGKYFADENGENEIAASVAIIPASHSFENKLCTVCGALDIPFTISANSDYQIDTGTFTVEDYDSRDYTINDDGGAEIPLYTVHFKSVPTTCTISTNTLNAKTLKYKPDTAYGTQLTANNLYDLGVIAKSQGNYSYYYVATDQTVFGTNGTVPTGRNKADADQFAYAVKFDLLYKEESINKAVIKAMLYEKSNYITKDVALKEGEKLTASILEDLYKADIRQPAYPFTYNSVWTYNDKPLDADGMEIKDGETYILKQDFDAINYTIRVYYNGGDLPANHKAQGIWTTCYGYKNDGDRSNTVFTDADGRPYYQGWYNITGYDNLYPFTDAETGEISTSAMTLVRPSIMPVGKMFTGWKLTYYNEDFTEAVSEIYVNGDGTEYTRKTALGNSAPERMYGTWGNVVAEAQYTDEVFVYAVEKGDESLGDDYYMPSAYSPVLRKGWSIVPVKGTSDISLALNTPAEIEQYTHQEADCDFDNYYYYAIVKGDLIEFWLRTGNGYKADTESYAITNCAYKGPFSNIFGTIYSPDADGDADVRRASYQALSDSSEDGIIRFDATDTAAVKMPASIKGVPYADMNKTNTDNEYIFTFYANDTKIGESIVCDSLGNYNFVENLAYGDKIRFTVTDKDGNDVSNKIRVFHKVYKDFFKTSEGDARGKVSYGVSYLTNKSVETELYPDKNNVYSYYLTMDMDMYENFHYEFVFLYETENAIEAYKEEAVAELMNYALFRNRITNDASETYSEAILNYIADWTANKGDTAETGIGWAAGTYKYSCYYHKDGAEIDNSAYIDEVGEIVVKALKEIAETDSAEAIRNVVSAGGEYFTAIKEIRKVPNEIYNRYFKKINQERMSSEYAAVILSSGYALADADDEAIKSTHGSYTAEIKGAEKTDRVSFRISVEALKALAENGGDLTIDSAIGSVMFSSAAVNRIATSATLNETTITERCNYIYINIINTHPQELDCLSAEQLNVIGNRNVIDINVTNDRGDIIDFYGADVTVTAPYTLQPGESTDNIAVFYVNNAGKVEMVYGTYENGAVTFTTNHFSAYIAAEAATKSAKCVTVGDLNNLIELVTDKRLEGFNEKAKLTKEIAAEMLTKAGLVGQIQ